MEHILVYRITCLVNSKAYIGITARTSDERWEEHVSAALLGDSSRVILRAIKKYGAPNFAVEEICVALGRENACEIERLLIAECRTLHPGGYNLTTGGEGTVGKRASERAKQNLSAAVKRLWADPEQRAKMVAAMQNRTCSDEHAEHLRRLAAEKKGKPHSTEHAAKIAEALRGKTHTDERRANISAALKGKSRWSEERKRAHGEKARAWYAAQGTEAISELKQRSAAARWADPEFRARRTGQKASEETKKKMRAAWVERRARNSKNLFNGKIEDEAR